MNAQALTINNISIRKDELSRFCLNDLHKAAGKESRHQPGKFLETQQASELIKLLEIEQSITGNPVILTKQGIGTYAIKEIVYSYAMWISAKFHLAVIRAYDALVTYQIPSIPTPPERKTKKALPGCLTLEHQDNIKALVKRRVEHLPTDKQAGQIIKQWSAVKQKFGCTYKEIPDAEYLNVVSLIERLPIEGELLTPPAKTQLQEIATTTEYDYAHARQHIEQIRQAANIAMDDSLLNEFVEELNKLEKCIVKAWTEMDEAIFRMQHSLTFLKRWRNH